MLNKLWFAEAVRSESHGVSLRAGIKINELLEAWKNK